MAQLSQTNVVLLIEYEEEEKKNIELFVTGH